MEAYGDAFAYYKKALAVAVGKKDSSNIAKVYNSMGTLRKDEGDLKSSLLFYEKASLNSINNSALRSLITLNKAKVFLEQEEFDLSFQYTHRAMMLLNLHLSNVLPESASINDYELVGNKIRLLEILKTRTSLWMKLHKKEKKQDYLENGLKLSLLSDQLLGIIRQQSAETQSKLFWQEQASEIYYNGVSAAFGLNNIAKAHYFMEKNKALLLQENMASDCRRSSAQLPDSVIGIEFQLKNNIAHLEATLAKDGNSNLDSLTDMLFQKKQEYSEFTNNLAASFPAYHAIKKPIQILGLKQINVEGNVLEYLLPPQGSDKKGYGFFSNGRDNLLFQLPKLTMLVEKLQAYRQFLSQPFQSKQDQIDFNILAFEKIQVLFKGEQITIIPDGALQNIPFEALISNQKENTYLMEACEIRYLYSLSFAQESMAVERRPKSNFAGFAPGNFGYDRLAPLEQTKNEIVNIRNVLDKGKIFTGSQASIANFKESSGQYRILHLATHADAQDSIAPWIAFADQKLSLFDLYTTKNQADIVVLSACNTSLGKIKEGEGILSLARGFFNSGAGSVLSSLWAVNDGSGSQIMTRFYKSLKDGKSKSQSLREAKLAYLNNQSGSLASPYYWASYVLIGDSTPLSSSHFSWWWLVFGLGLILLFLGMYKYYRKKVDNPEMLKVRYTE